jgi:hypothetical protein
MINLSFYYRNNSTLEQRITTLSLNHQILSPYTAFVGVETTAPKTNISSKVRHVPIQISKGDEHLFNQQFPPSYSFGMAPMPMMSAPGGPPMSYGMANSPPAAHTGYGGSPMYAYRLSRPSKVRP